MDDPFAKDRAKNRRVALLVTAVVLVTAGAVLAILYVRSPERVMDNHRASIERTRARYCKVLENEKKTEPRVAMPKAAELGDVVSLGRFYFDSSYPERGGNMDAIELDELEAVCAKKSGRSQSISSTFAGVVEPNENLRGYYKKKGLEEAVVALERLQYLLVVRVDQMTSSSAVGEKGLAAGRFKSRAALWRLSDGAYVDGVDVRGDAPGIAFVEKGHEDIQLKIQTDDALKDEIAREFGKKGLLLKLR